MTNEISNLEYINTIIVTQYQNYSIRDVPKEFQNKCDIKTLPATLSKVSKRILPNLFYENLTLKNRLPKIVRELKKTQSNWLFSPCGVNPNSLGRAYQISQASGLPLAVYLVDDFLSGAILAGHKENFKIAQENISFWLQKVDRIFVISEGLRQRIWELYQLDSIVLPLPYEITDISFPNSSELSKQQIIFVGSLSHFYLDGLRDIANVIDSINKQGSNSLKLRLTSCDIKSVKKNIGNFDFIECQPCTTAKDLSREIASSLLAFAPYSFDEKYRVMVSSSFPSKMLDYLTASKFILTYAPQYSTSVNYFEKYNLPKNLHESNLDKMKHIIMEQLIYQKNYSQKYQETVRKLHSFSNISKIIISSIANTELINQ